MAFIIFSLFTLSVHLLICKLTLTSAQQVTVPSFPPGMNANQFIPVQTGQQPMSIPLSIPMAPPPPPPFLQRPRPPPPPPSNFPDIFDDDDIVSLYPSPFQRPPPPPPPEDDFDDIVSLNPPPPPPRPPPKILTADCSANFKNKENVGRALAMWAYNNTNRFNIIVVDAVLFALSVTTCEKLVIPNDLVPPEDPRLAMMGPSPLQGSQEGFIQLTKEECQRMMRQNVTTDGRKMKESVFFPRVRSSEYATASGIVVHRTFQHDFKADLLTGVVTNVWNEPLPCNYFVAAGYCRLGPIGYAWDMGDRKRCKMSKLGRSRCRIQDGDSVICGGRYFSALGDIKQCGTCGSVIFRSGKGVYFKLEKAY